VQTGLGFCLLKGGEIVSWCLSVYASGAQIELGLATDPDHRGRGYATLTAAACLEYCTGNGLEPHWHCWEDNLPSIRVAEKVGFERPVHYLVYRFQL
jgi:RimJ/RimL family protein N-acetyltransferase